MKCVLCGVLTKSVEVANFVYYYWFLSIMMLSLQTTLSEKHRDYHQPEAEQVHGRLLYRCLGWWCWGCWSPFPVSTLFFTIIWTCSSYPLLWGKNNPHRCSALRFFSPTPLLMQDNSLTCSSSIFYNTQFNFPFRFPKLFSVGCLWHACSTRFNWEAFCGLETEAGWKQSSPPF